LSVYVDDANISWRGKRWCHLYADSLSELVEFGDHIGLKREWLQNPDGTSERTGQASLPHFDVTGQMLDKAVTNGATLVTGGDGTYRRLRRALSSGEYPMGVTA